MDYIEIILRGYANENNRKFMSEYFMREFRKAEIEHYNLLEFFTGLIDGIKTLKDKYNEPLIKRKLELGEILEGAKGTSEYGDLKNEFYSIRAEDFPLNLSYLTNNKLIGHLYHSQVEFIGNEIAKAYRVLNEPQKTKANKNNDVYKTQNLFKVGLLFATGKMNKYFTINNKNEMVIKEGYSAPKIVEELGTNISPIYFSASINNYNDRVNGNKNIFNSLSMMQKIIIHCKAEKLDIDPYFESRMPIE